MSKFFALALCLLAVITTLEAAATKYTTKYDNVNIDEILGNDRLLMSYYNCIMDKGKCTADGAELKKVLPDAIKNECSGCSETQKEGAEKVIKHLHDNKKDLWNDLLTKYDPEGTLREKYKDKADSVFSGKQ